MFLFVYAGVYSRNIVAHRLDLSAMIACNQAVVRAFFVICCVCLCIFNKVSAEPGNLFQPAINVEGEDGVISLVVVPGASNLVQGSNELHLSRTKLRGRAIDVASYLNLAYVLTDQSVLYVFNLDDPINPLILSSLTLPGTAQSLHVSGNRAYIGTEKDGVEVVDLTEPSNPVLLVENVGTGGATDINVAGIYAYVANDNKQQQPMSLDEYTSLAFHASLDDRVKGRTGTNVEIYGGLHDLVLAEIELGILRTPSTNYSIENDFGTYIGSLQFSGGSTDGPLIIGNKADFKSLLNFADSPAIIGFWFGTGTLTDTPFTFLSAGRHGPYSLSNGGWSVFLFENQVRLAIARKNHPSQPSCAVVSSTGSTRQINVADGKRHLVVAVYDPIGEAIYVYVDAVKSTVINISNCRADTDGDDGDELSGSGIEWLTIGEAGQASGIRSFFNGGMHNILILSPSSIPQEIDAIVREWYTLGLPGNRARGIL